LNQISLVLAEQQTCDRPLTSVVVPQPRHRSSIAALRASTRFHEERRAQQSSQRKVSGHYRS
jgi:hypothetical protein